MDLYVLCQFSIKFWNKKCTFFILHRKTAVHYCTTEKQPRSFNLLKSWSWPGQGPLNALLLIEEPLNLQHNSYKNNTVVHHRINWSNKYWRNLSGTTFDSRSLCAGDGNNLTQDNLNFLPLIPNVTKNDVQERRHFACVCLSPWQRPFYL